MDNSGFLAKFLQNQYENRNRKPKLIQNQMSRNTNSTQLPATPCQQFLEDISKIQGKKQSSDQGQTRGSKKASAKMLVFMGPPSEENCKTCYADSDSWSSDCAKKYLAFHWDHKR